MAKKNTRKTPPLKYGLHAILTTKFEYCLAKNKFNKDSQDLINYHVTPRISFDAEQETVIISMQVEAVIKETSEQMMFIETNFVFRIIDFKKHVVKKIENGKKLMKFKDQKNEGLFKVLMSVSYSTMRGIVLEKSQGTILEKVYLPIVDPNLLFKITQT